MDRRARFYFLIQHFTLFLFLFIGGLATSRIAFEWLFPRAVWLANPVLVLVLVGSGTLIFWAQWGQRLGQRALYFAPLLLNLLYLGEAGVPPQESRLYFFAALWLILLLFAVPQLNQRPFWGVLIVWLALLPLYVATVSHTVGRDDTFEFQVVTPHLGIVHPTGYPLYLLLGWPFTALPFGSTAFRLNLASIVYTALAMGVFYLLLLRWWKRPLPACLTAVVIGLTPTLWSQAIVAEVYALHALLVAGVLFVTFRILKQQEMVDRRWVIGLAALLGVGMTNHVTTVLLLPAVLFVLLMRHRRDANFNLFHPAMVGRGVAAGLLPLLLYAYLPLRWRAVNGEPMGASRFVDWVVGGRFQDALVWRAWLEDPARYEIVGRLFLENWGSFNLIIAVIGLLILFYKDWQSAVLLLLVFMAYTFYCLNYYVPDLAVFLIPAQIMVGVYWGAAFFWGIEMGNLRIGRRDVGISMLPFFLVIFLVATVWHVAQTFPEVDQSKDDGRTRWGTAVLNLPLADSAAILADSVRFPPLYYLQKSEGARPDLDISVWPDEAAYRAQLDRRLSVGQTVYLARFLPGLEGIYHLNSMGPLLHVSTTPLLELPNHAERVDLTFENLHLIGYAIEPIAKTDLTRSAVTLYWRAISPPHSPQYIYVRWNGFDASTGQHPANNSYPTVAWKGDEVVADYHEWPYPSLEHPQRVTFEVAVGPPFSREDDLEWHGVTNVMLQPNVALESERPIQVVINNLALSAIAHPEALRPEANLTAVFEGKGNPEVPTVALQLMKEHPMQPAQMAFVWRVDGEKTYVVKEVETNVANGRYLLVLQSDESIICGWMRVTSTHCPVGDVVIDGVPLPPTATNFEDKIALLNIEVDETTFQSGGQIEIIVQWQTLADMTEDYTVFLQILTENDQIVGQVDSWPVQGTRPTSQWRPGETIRDPYRVQLDENLAPGVYKVQVGFYLLETLRRLSIVDESGGSVGDAYVRTLIK